MSVEHWENYYGSGQLATCPTGPDGGYDQELRTAWEEFFSPLPDGARLLDIGTGNGAVLAIAVEHAARLGRSWQLHGSDLANIDPRRDVADGQRRFAGVVFHPRVASEQLPFACELDAVCGQYALEYAEHGAVLAEIARVLRPGGRAQFIAHHADSVILRNARASLAECAQVLEEWRVFARLREWLCSDGADVLQREQAAQGLQQLVRTLKAATQAAAPGAPGGGLILRAALDAVHQLLLLRTRLGPDAMDAEISLAEQQVLASRQRLQDLCGRALDEPAVEAMLQQARAAGLVALAPLPQFHARTQLVGWRLQLGKAAGTGAA